MVLIDDTLELAKASQPKLPATFQKSPFPLSPALRLSGDKNRLDRDSGPPAYSLLRLGLIHTDKVVTMSRKCNNSATHYVLELQLSKRIKHINERPANCFPGNLLWLGPRNERVPDKISLPKPGLAWVPHPG